MTNGDAVELTLEQLDALTAEVTRPDGPPTGPGSHTQRFNDKLIEEFRRNAGTVPGELSVLNMMLLTTVGARSRQKRTVPLSYYLVDGRMVVVASMGGAHMHPPWYHNVVANPEVEVEVGHERFSAEAKITNGEDRDHLFGGVVQQMPVFGEYQQKTERILPVIELVRRA